MKIEFSWRTQDTNLSAAALAGPIGKVVDLPLLPNKRERMYWEIDRETFSFVATSLSDKILVEPSQWNQSRDVCCAIHEILHELSTRGLTATPFIDGLSFINYSAQQQKLAADRKTTMNEAVEMLRATRNWFGDKRLASIRFLLQNAR